MSDPKLPPKDVEKYASEFLASNLKWAQRMNQVFPQYFPDSDAKQEPKIFWIGCSDSRVQESDATTSLPGNVFVHRNIANQFHLDDDNALSVLAYALAELGAQHVVVVGHRHCGGAISAMNEAARAPEPGNAKHQPAHLHSPYGLNVPHDSHITGKQDEKDPKEALTRWLAPLVGHVRQLALPKQEEVALDVVIEENVKVQVNNLTKLDSFIKKSAKARPVWIHGWVYDFSTGFIKDLEITQVLG
ncbi:carbonic anhydrase [Paxillus ammoniavirescens]|nr:carbonic anhydrase [Paxillus ammoniavirescens]